MTEQISNYRKYFNIDEDVAYLNSAYMGLLPKESVLRGSQGFELKSKSWKIHWEDFYIRPENTRKLFSKLINADTDSIFFTPVKDETDLSIRVIISLSISFGEAPFHATLT